MCVCVTVHPQSPQGHLPLYEDGELLAHNALKGLTRQAALDIQPRRHLVTLPMLADAALLVRRGLP